MGSDEGATNDQLLAVAVEGALDASLFSARQVAALAYAEAMTIGDVDDELFDQVKSEFTDDEIVELTGVIAWENSSARFNRALRIPSQNLWNPDQR